MKVLLLLIPIWLSATDFNYKLELTKEFYDNKPAEGFYDYKQDPSIIGEVKAAGSIENVNYKMVISNKYDDTYLDTLAVETNHRYNNIIYGSKIGTISTLKGIFDLQRDSSEQAPLIGGENAIYTNRMRKGGFEQTIGAEPYVGFIWGNVLFKLRYNYSHMRVLSQEKLNIGMVRYDSKYADVKPTEPFRGGGFTLLYNNWDFFYDNVDVGFEYKTELTQDEMLAMYIADPSNFDTSLLSANKGTQAVKMVRYGFTKYTSNYLFGYEYINYHQTNKETNTDKGNYAENIYIAYYGLKDITPYIMTGYSQRVDHGRDSGTKTWEYVGGIRNKFKGFSIITEYRETKWWQTSTLEDYKANSSFFSGDGETIKMLAVRAIIKF